MKRIDILFILLCCLGLARSSFALDKGTTIIGTKDAPNVLNVVPWQSRELDKDPWKNQHVQQSDLLKDSLKPVDRDELHRQVDYFNLLQHSPSQPAEQ